MDELYHKSWMCIVGLSGAVGSRKSPSPLGLSAVRGPRCDELPLAIPEIPVERELKLEESPTTPSSTCSPLSKATLTCQYKRTLWRHKDYATTRDNAVDVVFTFRSIINRRDE